MEHVTALNAVFTVAPVSPNQSIDESINAHVNREVPNITNGSDRRRHTIVLRRVCNERRWPATGGDGTAARTQASN